MKATQKTTDNKRDQLALPLRAFDTIDFIRENYKLVSLRNVTKMEAILEKINLNELKK